MLACYMLSKIALRYIIESLFAVSALILMTIPSQADGGTQCCPEGQDLYGCDPGNPPTTPPDCCCVSGLGELPLTNDTGTGIYMYTQGYQWVSSGSDGQLVQVPCSIQWELFREQCALQWMNWEETSGCIPVSAVRSCEYWKDMDSLCLGAPSPQDPNPVEEVICSGP